MRLSDYFRGESKYLRADDLEPNERIDLIIDVIEIEIITNPKTQKKKDSAVVYFKGWPRRRAEISEKGLVLNTINGDTLTEAYGDDIGAPAGKSVVLLRTTTKYGRDTVPCLRLEIANGDSESKGTVPADPPEGDPPF